MTEENWTNSTNIVDELGLNLIELDNPEEGIIQIVEILPGKILHRADIPINEVGKEIITDPETGIKRVNLGNMNFFGFYPEHVEEYGIKHQYEVTTPIYLFKIDHANTLEYVANRITNKDILKILKYRYGYVKGQNQRERDPMYSQDQEFARSICTNDSLVVNINNELVKLDGYISDTRSIGVGAELIPEMTLCNPDTKLKIIASDFQVKSDKEIQKIIDDEKKRYLEQQQKEAEKKAREDAKNAKKRARSDIDYSSSRDENIFAFNPNPSFNYSSPSSHSTYSMNIASPSETTPTTPRTPLSQPDFGFKTPGGKKKSKKNLKKKSKKRNTKKRNTKKKK